MTMKRTEIEKRNGLKIASKMRRAGHRYDARRRQWRTDVRSVNANAPRGWYRSQSSCTAIWSGN